MTSCKPVSFSRRTLHHGVSEYIYVTRGGILTTGGVPDIQLGVGFLHDEDVVVGAQALGLVQSVCSVCAYGLVHHQVSHAQFYIIAVKSEAKLIFVALSACLTLNCLLSCSNAQQYIDYFFRILYFRVDTLLFFKNLGSQR